MAAKHTGPFILILLAALVFFLRSWISSLIDEELAMVGQGLSILGVAGYPVEQAIGLFAMLMMVFGVLLLLLTLFRK